MADQVHTCADLGKQIHLDLRIQHPEWVQADGESPVCDSYEDRLMELLAGLTDMKPNQSYDCDRYHLQQRQTCVILVLGIWPWHDSFSGL